MSKGDAPPPKRPVVLFVLGFGRSGSSALTRVLSLCGAALPPGLVGATVDNPRGYFEPRAAVGLNQAILRRLGTSGYDPGLGPHREVSLSAGERAEWTRRIAAYLATLPPAPLTVIKEPKMTAISDLWFEGARTAGFDVGVVVTLRHPDEVAESLARRGRRQHYVHNSPQLTGAWWLKYTLLAERRSRGVPRVVVEYANLLTDWRREVTRVATALGVDLCTDDGAAVSQFLTSELRHHREFGPVTELFGTHWLSTVYATLARAGRDEPVDESALDEVYESYAEGERGFRQSFEDYRRYRNLDRILRPSVVKLALGTLAVANRRKGTWS